LISCASWGGATVEYYAAQRLCAPVQCPRRTIRLVNERLQRANGVAGKLRENVETVVIGKPDQIRLVLTALACRGHVLLEDVPGCNRTDGVRPA
jgi:hypothetical protein